jgi:dynein assembly factor 1
MDKLNNLATYFIEKDRKKNEALAKQSSDGLPEMTREEIRLSCIENDGYETPELNEKLYLHFKGFRRIENLDQYTGCKAIWLDSNGLEEISGLDKLLELRCLYLGKNLISNINGLSSLKNLHSIDLSNNRISFVQNLSCCPNLQTVNLSRNSLHTMESIEHLCECPSLQTLDLTNNFLEGDLLGTLVRMLPLLSLSINGNPVTQASGFRKKIIVALPKLGYLDRPVDEQERFFATAFANGGQEAEANARSEWQELQKNKRVAEMEAFRKWQQEQVQQRLTAKNSNESAPSSQILQFTADELELRRIEVEKAVAAEKRLLEIGIGRIGAEYWRGDGKMDLDDIVASVIGRSELAEESKGEVGVEDVSINLNDECEGSNINGDGAIVDAVVVSDSGARDKEHCQNHGITETNVDEKEYSISIVEEADKCVSEEVESQAVRDQRVSDSLRIFLAQQERKSEPLAEISHKETWSHTATWNHNSNSQIPAPLYWTEAMDLALADQVAKYMFDFDKVAVDMSAKYSKSIVSNDCRVRWSQLDARQWSATEDNNENFCPPVYRVCIQPDVLGKGHGAQPSFQALASNTAGNTPTYLKVPLSFPSVIDFSGDDDSALNTLD